MENYLFFPKRKTYLVNGASFISTPANLNLSLNLNLCLDEYSSNLYWVLMSDSAQSRNRKFGVSKCIDSAKFLQLSWVFVGKLFSKMLHTISRLPLVIINCHFDLCGSVWFTCSRPSTFVGF